MTQEKIVSEVKLKLGTTQVSDKTITEIVALLPLAEGTEPDAAYYDKIVNLCKSFQGNLNSVASQSVKDAKAEWEKEKKTPEKTEEEKKDEKKEESPELKALMDRIAALEKDKADNAAKQSTDVLRNNVLNKADELKVSNKALWNDVVAAMEVKEDSKHDDLLTAAKSAYESKLKSYFGEGGIPYGKSEGGSGDDKGFESFFAGKKAEGKMELDQK